MSREKGKREQILKAAIEVFGSKGFHTANIIDIAEKAGIGKGTIYEYFESKNSLFIEAIRYKTQIYLEKMECHINKYNSFYDKINAFIDFQRIVIKENFNFADVFIKNHEDTFLTADDKKEACDLMIKARKKVIEILADILDPKREKSDLCVTDEEFTADIFYEMVTRCGIRAIAMNLSEKQIACEKEKLRDLFFNGVKHKAKHINN